jgi:osmotically-inducible protein OsmY
VQYAVRALRYSGLEDIKMYKKTDAQLKHDVDSAISWDTRTWDQKIEPAVHDGIVTLNGTVSSYAAKVAAESVVHQVKGVTDVANELFVRPNRPHPDAEIARAVRHALEWAALVPHRRITTTVTDGWVQLEGRVNSLTERSDAEWIAENLVGVAGVINKLEVEPHSVDAKNLRRSIETVLERRAEREAEGLRVDVVNGEVSLFGRVHSWPERKAVVGCISHAPGVKKVTDNLRIDPYF